MGHGEGPRNGVLVERERELGRLSDVLERAVRGRGAAVVVRGPAGIGKSRLLGEAGIAAERSGAATLRAAGAVLEAEYPFGVVRQLLEPVAADCGRRAVMLAGAGAPAAPVLASDHAPPGVPDAQFAVLHGVFWAFANLAAAQPLVVLVDDAQWADDASLRWVDYLARRVEDLPVALVLGWRPGERAAVDTMVDELEAAVSATVIEPVGLTEAGVGRLVPLVFERKPAPTFVAACHARTGGNPFFVMELLRELRSLGVAPTADGAAQVAAVAPRSVGRVVLARLARLGPAASALARAVAVLGDGAHLLDAAELAGLSRPAASDAASALTAAGVLSDDGRLSVTHPIMRDAIQADMSPSMQAAAHRDAAQVLADHGRDADQIAAQVVLSPPSGDGWIVAQLLAAARSAIRRGAPDVALPLLRRALTEPPLVDVLPLVLFELGLAEDALQRREAIGHLRAARNGFGPGRQRGEAALALAHALVLAGRTGEVYDVVADAQAELGSRDREVSLALEAVLLNACSFDPAGRARLAGRLERLAQLKGETPAERAVLACVAFEATKSSRPLAEVAELAERALGSGPRGYAAAADPLAPLLLAVVFHASGMISRSVGLASELIDEARHLGSLVLFAEASTARAHAHWRGGSLADAEADARQALASVGPRFGQAHTLATAVLIGALTDRGLLDEAAAVAKSFDTPDRRTGDAIQGVADCSLAYLELTLGRYEQAISRLYRAGRVIDAVGCTNPAGGEWRQPLAIALAAVGRTAKAREVLAPALDSARRSGEPYELGVTLRAAALIDRPARIDTLEEAAGVLADSEIRLQNARVLIDLGAALRRMGKRREARDPLADGMDAATRCGAEPLVERARAELLASGARPRRSERTGAEALTPSEARVARFASDGMTNREIAQHLFVSPRTVEAQLRAVYTKLHITSREMITGSLGDRISS